MRVLIKIKYVLLIFPFAIQGACPPSQMFSRICLILQNIENTTNNLNSIVDEIASVTDELSSSLDGCDFNVTSIHQSDVPYVITEPGRYCLAEDVSLTTAADAITISLPSVIDQRVVLDLNDYTISGLFADVPTGNNGVVVVPTANPPAVEIKNGTISGMIEHGIHIPVSLPELIVDTIVTEFCGSSGISSDQGGIVIGTSTVSTNAVIRNCRATGGFIGHTGAGIRLTNCRNYLLSNCNAVSNGLDGIITVTGLGGVFENCLSSLNGGNGIMAVAELNTVFYNCTAESNGFAGIGSGFLLDDSICSLRNCFASFNATHGFSLDNNNNQVVASMASNNFQTGFNFIGNQIVVTECEAINNAENGFLIQGNNALLRGNTATGNDTSAGGFYGFNDVGTSNRIYGNFANNNNGGASDFSPSITNVVISPTATTPADLNFTANISQ